MTRPISARDYEARFWSKVDVQAGGCWERQGFRSSDGYSVFGANGKKYKAHRFAWEAAKASIAPGLQIDHLCRNRACINPEHLEPVTQQENIARGETGKYLTLRALAKTHCSRGHELVEANTLTDAGGNRRCRTCNRARCADYRQRKNKT